MSPLPEKICIKEIRAEQIAKWLGTEENYLKSCIFKADCPMFVTAPSLTDSPLAPDNCHKVQFSCQLRERLCKTFIAQRSSLVQAPSDETLRGIVCVGYADW